MKNMKNKEDEKEFYNLMLREFNNIVNENDEKFVERK